MNYVGMTGLSSMTGLSGGGIGNLHLRYTDNNDGSITLDWFGFDLAGVDALGTWTVKYSEDGGATWNDFVTGILPATDTASYDGSDGLLLGAEYLWQIHALDSGLNVIKVSNIVTDTLPEPWQLSNVVAFLDANPLRLETVAGIRLTGAGAVQQASQHYSAPHISSFDGAAALTLIYWKKEYGPSNVGAMGYIQQGVYASDGAAFSSGFALSGGTFGGNHCADSCSFRVYSGGAAYDAYISGAQENALGFSSSFAITYNAGTVRIWIDGVEKTVTHTPSFPATLPNSGAALLRIGRGYYGANHTFCHASGYTRVLTPTEITDLTLGLDKPVTYGALSDEQKIGLAFHYELGKTTCDHTSATLSAVTGGGVAEDTVVGQYEPVSGQWLRTSFGSGSKLDESGIFQPGVPCLHNDAVVNPSNPASRCTRTAAISTAPFTSGSNSWVYEYKPTNVAAAEYFGAAVNGLSPNALNYLMPGYGTYTGSKYAGMRTRSNAATPAFDGWQFSNLTMPANTAYLSFWHVDNGTYSHTQNGSPGTLTPSYSTGSAPNSFAAVLHQDNIGVFGGGASWPGYEGVTILCDPKLTAAQQTQLEAYYS